MRRHHLAFRHRVDRARAERDREHERAAHEDERLLYVAATRAIRRLHLVGVATADAAKDDGLKPPAAGTLLKLLWPGVAQPAFAAALASLALRQGDRVAFAVGREGEVEAGMLERHQLGVELAGRPRRRRAAGLARGPWTRCR